MQGVKKKCVVIEMQHQNVPDRCLTPDVLYEGEELGRLPEGLQAVDGVDEEEAPTRPDAQLAHRGKVVRTRRVQDLHRMRDAV
ncbi:hypothetical protein AVEN_52043-1 [Araneus ventricosus]|uniref:Uncharacterized protein n=1 Tax=Araneus ventricosus TaxID=182803 RepID=A0A4Y2CF67_ARAVE|nr:hypothetical protein AVEN_52043-1 [Araneus ventricosus]